MMRRAPLILALLAAPFWLPIQAAADYKEIIGYYLLQDLTSPNGYIKDGKDLTGAGIGVAMVEAPSNGNHMPNAGNAEFSGKTFTNKSGTSGTSGHATNVARSFFGNTTGIAAGITAIDVYEVNNWLGTGYLRTGAPLSKPVNDGNKVFNHSWAGSMANSSLNETVIRRLDWAVRNHGVISVVGVDNYSGIGISPLLASSFNSIAVGLADGDHKTGQPPVYGEGRTKPDIVAPGAAGQLTSYSTPVVAAGAVLMIDAAKSIQDATERENAQRPEVVKALLMGGATKNTLDSWSNTETAPLDSVYGAGILNVANSYRILASGQQTASAHSDVANTGWDFGSADSFQKYYFFEIEEGFHLAEFTAFMTWNAVVDDNLNSFTLGNLDLMLYQAEGYDLVGEAMVTSASTGYSNNELIYLEYLVSGRYALVVDSAGLGEDYAITWFGEPGVIPEPATIAWIVLTGLLVLSYNSVKRWSPASAKLSSRHPGKEKAGTPA